MWVVKISLFSLSTFCTYTVTDLILHHINFKLYALIRALYTVSIDGLHSVFPDMQLFKNKEMSFRVFHSWLLWECTYRITVMWMNIKHQCHLVSTCISIRLRETCSH